MIQAIRKLIRPRPDATVASVPDGQRVYAIGDIHGRLDLFAALGDAIERDDAARGPADTTIVLLGDLVDRGPDSALVLEAAREWQKLRRVRIIRGNHEEMFLLAFRKEPALRNFLRFGGQETVLSYPVDAAAFQLADFPEAQAMMDAAVPQADRDFINTFEDQVRIGDYLFVHAGIQPGVPLERQTKHEMRWIREPFLSHSGSHGCVVVHGHTISDEVEIRPNRIGLDTGAFMTGRLTALGLEGTERWLIETSETEGQIGVATRQI
jgi:serine/threonine protein phosphatase 1